MTTPFLGEIQLFGFNFPPRGWATCNGATLPISQYTALFSLLGTTYGGNGQTTFQLPNFSARAPCNQGAGLPVRGQCRARPRRGSRAHRSTRASCRRSSISTGPRSAA